MYKFSSTCCKSSKIYIFKSTINKLEELLLKNRLVLLVFSSILGILSGYSSPHSFLFGILIILLFIFFFFCYLRDELRIKKLFLLFTLFFSIYAFRTSYILDKEYFSISNLKKTQNIQGIVISMAKSKAVRKGFIHIFLVKTNIGKVLIKYFSFSPICKYTIGDTIKITGRIKCFSSSFNYSFSYFYPYILQGVKGVIYPRRIILVKESPYLLFSIIKNLHFYFIKKSSVITNKDLRALFIAILTGNRVFISYELYTKFQKTFTGHLISVSGFHIGIFVMFLSFLLSFFLPKIKYRYPVIIFILIGYIIFTGFRAPVIRAGVMMIIYMLSIIFHRKIPLLHILLYSALFILFIRPWELYMPGFQLSFLSILGIYLMIKRFGNVINFKSKIYKNIYSYILMSIGAWIFVVPIIAYHFCGFSIFGILCNILMVPLFYILFISFYIVGIFIDIVPYISNALNLVFTPILHFMNFLYNYSFYQIIPPPYFYQIFLYYCGILVLFLSSFRYKTLISLSIIIITINTYLSDKYTPQMIEPLPSGTTYINFSDVSIIINPFYRYNITRYLLYYRISDIILVFNYPSRRVEKLVSFIKDIFNIKDVFFLKKASVFYIIPPYKIQVFKIKKYTVIKVLKKNKLIFLRKFNRVKDCVYSIFSY